MPSLYKKWWSMACSSVLASTSTRSRRVRYDGNSRKLPCGINRIRRWKVRERITFPLNGEARSAWSGRGRVSRKRTISSVSNIHVRVKQIHHGSYNCPKALHRLHGLIAFLTLYGSVDCLSVGERGRRDGKIQPNSRHGSSSCIHTYCTYCHILNFLYACMYV